MLTNTVNIYKDYMFGEVGGVDLRNIVNLQEC